MLIADRKMNDRCKKTGLTKREKEVVRKSWDQICDEWNEKGPDFFVKYA